MCLRLCGETVDAAQVVAAGQQAVTSHNVVNIDLQGGMFNLTTCIVTLDSWGMPVSHQPKWWEADLAKQSSGLLPVATVGQMLLHMATHAPLDKADLCQVRTAIASVRLQELACSLGGV
jgi:hypothetical protein